jgi:hypothetical protein
MWLPNHVLGALAGARARAVTDILPLFAVVLDLLPMRYTVYIKANRKDKWAKVALRKVKEGAINSIKILLNLKLPRIYC